MTLVKWENTKILKDCSRVYYIGLELALIFDRFARALSLISEESPYHHVNIDIIWMRIKLGFSHEE